MNYETILKKIQTNIDELKIINTQRQEAEQKVRDTGAHFTFKGNLQDVPKGNEEKLATALKEFHKLRKLEEETEGEIYDIRRKVLNSLVVIPGDLNHAKMILGEKVQIFNLPYADKGLTLERKIIVDYQTKKFDVDLTEVSMQEPAKKSKDYKSTLEENLESTVYLLKNNVVGILVNGTSNKASDLKTNNPNKEGSRTYYGLPIALQK